MRFHLTLVLLALIGSGCSTIRLGDSKFSTHESYDMKNIPEHGFLVVDRDQNICNGEHTLRGGYAVKIRKPRPGETESEYISYQQAEDIRARVCAKAATWCSTQTDLLCRADDHDCKAQNRKMGERSTCRVPVTEGNANPLLSHIRGKVDDGQWINCGTGTDEYTSSLAWVTTTNKSFIRDRSKWTQFCQQQRSADECEGILRVYETDSFLLQPDSARWAVDSLVKQKPEVHSQDDWVYSTVEINTAPLCEMLENRYQ